MKRYGVADWLFPLTKCVACGAKAQLEGGLCPDCLAYLATFRLDLAQDAGKEGAYRSVYGAFAYRGCAREMVRALKFSGESRPAAVHFVPAIADLLRELGWTGRVLVPVPLSKERMIERGYNQSAHLAHRVARQAGCAVREDWLWRNRSTAQQMSLTLEEREKNVAGAFSAPKRVRGASVVLIDDVMTSGSTASACAHTLLGAGAECVDVLTATRAGFGEDGFARYGSP